MNERQQKTLELLRARFVEWLEARNYSPRTRPEYDRHVRDFLDWLSENTEAGSIADVAPQMVQNYQLALCHPPPMDDGDLPPSK